MLMMVLLFTVTTAFGATNSDVGSYMDSSGNISIEGASVPNTEFTFSGSNITANSVFDTTTFFAGNAITLNGEYNGDVFVAGNTVTINGKINGNLYGGANQIIINGEVAKDIFIGCSDLTISKTGKIDRDAFLAAANVNIDGLVERNLRAGAGNLNINGTINGMVEADVDQLTINDGAKITGPINNRSANQAIVSPSATAPTINWEKVVEDQTVKEKQGPSVGSILLSIITKLAFILVVWLLISFLTRDFNANSPVLAKKHIPASLGIGAGFFFLVPLLLIIAFVIYMPLGLAMTCLVIMLSIIGMPVAAVVLSKLLMRLFDGKMKPLLSSFLSVLVVSAAVIILGFIPIIGFIVALFMAAIGVGFICYNIIFAHRKLEFERQEMSNFEMIEEMEKNKMTVLVESLNKRK
jgi:cytoskeletal protein CcmA (bactofilin family)/preprotein translocase subunit Sss1